MKPQNEVMDIHTFINIEELAVISTKKLRTVLSHLDVENPPYLVLITECNNIIQCDLCSPTLINKRLTNLKQQQAVVFGV